MADVTQILSALKQGDSRAAAELLPLVYDELRKLAAQKLAQEKAGQTLQATALVHEAYVRLVGSGEAGAGAARCDELAGELDKVGGNLKGRLDGFEDWGLAEGDLFVEGEGLGLVGRLVGAELVGGGGWLRCGAGRLFVETDGEAGGGSLGGGCPRGCLRLGWLGFKCKPTCHATAPPKSSSA